MLTNIFRIQTFAIIGSIALFLFVFELIRRRKIKDQYAVLWLTITLFFIIISIWKRLIEFIAKFLGIYSAPSAFLLILIIAIFLILIQFSIIISKLKDENKILAQEIALLNEKMRK